MLTFAKESIDPHIMQGTSYERLALELVALLAAVADSILARQLSVTTALVYIALLAAQKSVTAEQSVGNSQAVAGGLGAGTGLKQR